MKKLFLDIVCVRMWESVMVCVLWWCNQPVSPSISFSAIWIFLNCHPPNYTYSSPFRIPKHLLVLKKSRWRLLELCTFLFSYCAYCGKYSCEFQHCLLKLYMGFMFCVCTLDYSISFVIALPITALLDYFTPVASTSETPSFTLDYFWITFSHGVISSSAVAFCSLQSTPLSHLLTELRLHNGVEAASSDFMMGVHSYHWILE